jgi:hypothetical protein
MVGQWEPLVDLGYTTNTYTFILCSDECEKNALKEIGVDGENLNTTPVGPALSKGAEVCVGV